MSTQIGCARDVMAQEARLIGLLQPVMRWHVDRSGALTLVAPDGRRITARRNE